MTTEGQRLLETRWPDAGDLRREFPYMADSLLGYFAFGEGGIDKFNVYEDGAVVSRDLIQSHTSKNPTVRVIMPGFHHFPTGNNTETLTVLEGLLEASVNGGPASRLRRDGTIIAPAGTTLDLCTHVPAFYICRYAARAE